MGSLVKLITQTGLISSSRSVLHLLLYKLGMHTRTPPPRMGHMAINGKWCCTGDMGIFMDAYYLR